MTQLGFYYDMTICTGCKTCQIACNDKNDLGVNTLFREVQRFDGGAFPEPWFYHLSLGCNHCEKPLCMANCPQGAITKDENGLVVQDHDKCIGCKTCMMSCPYGAPDYLEEEKKCGKCDGCKELLAAGEEPACVAACLMRALKFGDVEELRKQCGGTADITVLPASSETNPSLVLNPDPHAVTA